MLAPDRNHDQPIITIDRREKYPWVFDAPSVVQKLDVGDYSLLGFHNEVAIERKSLGNVIGSLSYERTRFEPELQRGRDLQCFCVIIEANWQDVFNKNYRSEMSPNAVRESVIAFQVRYGTPFIFTGSRSLAARLCESYLLRFLQEKKPGQLTRQILHEIKSRQNR
jgi:ERCC4-type nuclease